MSTFASAHYTTPSNPNWQAGTVNKSFSATDKTLPACPDPESRPLLTYGDAEGDELDITVPDGSDANIGMMSVSVKGDPGAFDIDAYDWKVAGTSVSSAASATHYFSAGEAVSLKVTDENSQNNTGYATVNIDYFSPCDDPFTDEVETCDDNPDSGETSVDGSAYEPGDWAVPVVVGTYVCYLTDWYENGVYTDTEIDYCTVE